jgi:hypothetical protein
MDKLFKIVDLQSLQDKFIPKFGIALIMTYLNK